MFASFSIFSSLCGVLCQPLVRCCFKIDTSSQWETSVGVENEQTNLQGEEPDLQTHGWLMLESNTVALNEGNMFFCLWMWGQWMHEKSYYTWNDQLKGAHCNLCLLITL